jgi:hypothetical protein
MSSARSGRDGAGFPCYACPISTTDCSSRERNTDKHGVSPQHAEEFRAGTRDHDVRATPGRCGYYLLDAGITSWFEFCENGANAVSWWQPAGVCAIPHRLAHLAQ